jgi:anti-anti-sigma factor
MTELEIIVREEPDGITTIALKGTVDAYSYNKLEETLNNLIEQEAYKLIVDLAQVDYMFSHGVGLLINMLGVVQKNSGNIVLLNPKPAVRETLELLGLNHLFTITNTDRVKPA